MVAPERVVELLKIMNNDLQNMNLVKNVLSDGVFFLFLSVESERATITIQFTVYGLQFTVYSLRFTVYGLQLRYA